MDFSKTKWCGMIIAIYQYILEEKRICLKSVKNAAAWLAMKISSVWTAVCCWKKKQFSVKK